MKKKVIAVLLTVSLMFQAIACGNIDTTRENNVQQEQEEIAKEESKKSNEKSNENVRYQDDFYEYVNANLLNMIELDETDAQWTWFGELSAVINQEMRDIIRDINNSTQTYEKGSSQQKIKDLYECISDMDNRNATGLGPLQPHLDTIRNAATIDEYVDALAKLSGEFGFSSIVGGYYIEQDKTDSDKYAVYMMYADTLIGKEYLENDQMQEYVTMYYDYMTDMFEEFGYTHEKAVQTTSQIDVLLRDICASTLSAEQYYNPSITWNVYSKEQLQELYSNIDIYKMLETLRIDSVDSYVVIDVEQAKKINSLLIEDNLDVLKEFSTFVMLNDVAEYATQNYAKLSQDIDNQLNGVSSMSDEYTWMRLTQDMLSWDFGKMYVETHFSEESKEDVEDMIHLILENYKDIINRQDWMSEATKQKAIKKLNTMNIKIGYPDNWPNSMEMLQITPISEGGSLLSNMLEDMKVSIEDNLQKLGKNVDKSLWGMTPQTINAYYDPGNNEIVFPAAILQAPFYDKDNDDAANWGGIGYVIAHEVSHAFDSNGAMYDENGNYNVWWSDEEIAEYEELSQSIISYYDNYEMIGVKVNGTLTLSENIADLGAMTCITDIVKALNEKEQKKALSKMFQQFAYIWASESTVSYQLYLLNNDTHAPNKIRVNAVVSSNDDFYDTFGIVETDGMYVSPENRVGIWK